MYEHHIVNTKVMNAKVSKCKFAQGIIAEFAAFEIFTLRPLREMHNRTTYLQLPAIVKSKI